MFLPLIQLVLLGLPSVHAEDWDDFSNNLATDLAPFLALFGEQTTKQYLSECITWVDYFIFAMAPLGILTATVSVIRVCGGPSLRAFVGRAQEGRGIIEAELCSSTSRDVCELYSNGGIARVFGRPKILEIVYDPTFRNSEEKPEDKSAGIYTVQDYLRGVGKEKWDTRDTKIDTETGNSTQAPNEVFAPNLSLNIGIRKQHALVFWLTGLIGLILQSGVLVFAVIAAYYLKLEKDGRPPNDYACPLVIVGTVLLCVGMYLCAFFIGENTDETTWHRKSIGKKGTSDEACFFWVQPGGQVIGDQIFDPFCHSDCDDPRGCLNEYTISWKKNKLENAQAKAWVAVITTVSGFVMQFTGLRGSHPSVSVAQLGATMFMSMARAMLRAQRLREDANRFDQFLDQVVGHELDWLALRIGRQDIEQDMKVTPSSSRHDYWIFCLARYSAENPSPSRSISLGSHTELSKPSAKDPSQGKPNTAEQILAYRTRLAKLTETSTGQSRSMHSTRNFDLGMVAVRQEAQKLVAAMQSAMNAIFSEKERIRDEWKTAESMWWRFGCTMSSNENGSSVDKRYHLLSFEFHRGEDSPWRLRSKEELEGLLGMWVWSLKSEEMVELKNQSGLTISVAEKVAKQRFLSALPRDGAEELWGWLGRESIKPTRISILMEQPYHGDPSMLWQQVKKGCYQPRGSGKTQPPDQRFFGWYGVDLQQAPRSKHGRFEIWSATTETSLLSLCTQEVFGSFLASILPVLDQVGTVDIGPEKMSHQAEHELVTQMVEIFNEAKLGSREDALLCILPPVMAPTHRTPLSLAAAHGLKDVVKEQLESKNVEVDAKDDDGRTALWWATRNRRDEVVKLLLDLTKLNPWTEDNHGGSAIWWATRHGNEETVRLFLEKTKTKTNPRECDEEASIDYAQEETTCSVSESTHGAHGVSPGKSNDEKAPSENEHHPTPQRRSQDRDTNPDQRLQPLLSLAATEGHLDVANLILHHMPDATDVNSTERRTVLCSAVLKGPVEVVEKLLKLGKIDPDARDPNGRTALSFAAQVGREKVVRLLLEVGKANPSLRDDDGRTAWSWAVQHGHVNVMATFLDTKAVDPNARDWDGRAALSLAAQSGRDEMVNLLLEVAKASPSLRDNDGRTAYSWAAQHGHVTVLNMLFQTGAAKPDDADHNGRTPLLWATISGQEAIVMHLRIMHHVNPRAKDKDGRTVLLHAAENGHWKIMEDFLVHEIADIDEKDHGGRTALSWAAANGREVVIKMILRGIRTMENHVWAQDASGHTALSRAAENGHWRCIEMLLEARHSDSEKMNTMVLEALSRAAENGHPECVNTLLKFSHSDYEKVSPRVLEALSGALKNGHSACVKMLLKIKLSGPEEMGTKVLQSLWRATKDKHIEWVKVMLEVVPDMLGEVERPETEKMSVLVGNSLLSAASEGHCDAIGALLDFGANVETTDVVDGETPLFKAAKYGHFDAATLLLQKGANPNAKNNEGANALAAAAMRGSKDVARLLLGCNVDPGAADNWGHTALTLAAESGHVEIVEMFLPDGGAIGTADPEAKTSDGWTLLGLAAYNGHERVVKFLVQREDVNPDEKCGNGQTPLSIAARFGPTTIVKQLLEDTRVDPEAPDNFDRMPLWWAADSGSINRVRLLLQTGKTDPRSEDKEGGTPLSRAMARCDGWIPEVDMLGSRRRRVTTRRQVQGDSDLCGAREEVVHLLREYLGQKEAEHDKSTG